MDGAGTEPPSRTYEIVVRGDVREGLAHSLGVRRVAPGQGSTLLIVEVVDQSHLHGVLEGLRDLNIEIERMNPA